MRGRAKCQITGLDIGLQVYFSVHGLYFPTQSIQISLAGLIYTANQPFGIPTPSIPFLRTTNASMSPTCFATSLPKTFFFGGGFVLTANKSREWNDSNISFASVLFICEADVSIICVNMALIFVARMSTSLSKAALSSFAASGERGLPQPTDMLSISMEAARAE